MPSLTHAEAAERGALLQVRSYQVDLDLTTGDQTFRAITRISFDARPASATFLDIRPSALRSVTLNGREVDPATLGLKRKLLETAIAGLGTQRNTCVLEDV